MKKVNVKLNAALLLMLFMIVGTLSFAQGGGNSGNQCSNIPDLTQDQKDKIEVLRTANQKTMLTFKNQLAVKNAQLEVLTTADKPDVAAINKMIDEIGALKIDMQKKRAEHRLAVRNLLTENQRIQFDASHGKGNCSENANGCGMGKGRGNCKKESECKQK